MDKFVSLFHLMMMADSQKEANNKTKMQHLFKQLINYKNAGRIG